MAEPSLRGRTRSAENSSYNESVFDQLGRVNIIELKKINE